MNSAAQMETINFEVHQDILSNLIFKQHHSLEGAMIELVQNAFDAGATRLDITFDKNGFSVIDNGSGFSSREDIIAWFATFGKSHDVDHSDRFCRFRMGRGQIMGKAKTCWTSNKYKMLVDVKNKGMTFDLSTCESQLNGCEITGEWYDKVEHIHEIAELQIELAKHCKYLFRMKIYVNGTLITVDEKTTAWDYEDNLYRYINTKEPDVYSSHYHYVAIYNLGVYCGSINAPGHCGDVITKEHVTLNMTRSEIQKDCRVIKRIKASLAKIRRFDNKKKYNCWQAQAILEDLLIGNVSLLQIKDLLLFTNTKINTWYSFDTMCSRKYAISYTENETANDRITQAFNGIVISSRSIPDATGMIVDTAENTGYISEQCEIRTVADKNKHNISLFNHFLQNFANKNDSTADIFEKIIDNQVPFEGLVQLADLSHHLLDYNELSEDEKMKFDALIKGYSSLSRYYYASRSLKLRAGDSVNANGWTDCQNFIALDRKTIARLDDGLQAAISIITVMIHELAHVKNSDGELHDANFYKTYHDLSREIDVIWIAGIILKEYDRLKFKKKKVPSVSVRNAMKFYRRDGRSFSAKNNNVFVAKHMHYFAFDLEHPVKILPFSSDIDTPDVDGETTIEPIILSGEESILIINWLSDPTWKETVRDLRYDRKAADGQRQITMRMPLVTFRNVFCASKYVKKPEQLTALLNELRIKTREWRNQGIDAIGLEGAHKAY